MSPIKINSYLPYVKNEEKNELVHGLGRFWDTKKENTVN